MSWSAARSLRQAADSKGQDDMNAETILSSGVSTPRERQATRLRYLFPLAAFAVLTITFGWALNHNRVPSEIPSPLIGRPVPPFTLPALNGLALALSSADNVGEVSLAYVFASLCFACLP